MHSLSNIRIKFKVKVEIITLGTITEINKAALSLKKPL
jgi:hypothetical protein